MAANYRVRTTEVVAKRHKGGTLTVINNYRGEQHAREGDWLVGPEHAERGEIEVLKNEDFERLYEPIKEQVNA